MMIIILWVQSLIVKLNIFTCFFPSTNHVMNTKLSVTRSTIYNRFYWNRYFVYALGPVAVTQQVIRVVYSNKNQKQMSYLLDRATAQPDLSRKSHSVFQIATFKCKPPKITIKSAKQINFIKF